MGMDLKDEDYIEHLFVASTHDYILFFTSVGKVYRLKVHELPLGSRQAKGRAIVNLLPFRQDEPVRAVIQTRDFEEADYLLFATKKGVVKKTELSEYNTPLKADGIIAIKMREDDELVAVRHAHRSDDILLVSRGGQAIRFGEQAACARWGAPPGVRGHALRGDDEVIAAEIAKDDSDLLVVTENGFGKRTRVSEYPMKARRDGRAHRATHRGARPPAGARVVRDGYQVMLISNGGTVISMSVDEVKRLGRSTQGVIVMRLREGEQVSRSPRGRIRRRHRHARHARHARPRGSLRRTNVEAVAGDDDDVLGRPPSPRRLCRERRCRRRRRVAKRYETPRPQFRAPRGR